MPTWTAANADCFVYAFKEGLLSAAGHDVKLRVTRFELTVSPDGTVTGSFDPDSIEVVCAMREGRENPGALSDRDHRTIEGYVRDDILQTERYDEITWSSTGLRRDGDGWHVEGQLTLHGRTKPVRARIEPRGDRLVTVVKIRQPDFGIKPFRALLGALKIKPVIEVELAVPATALP